MNTAAPQANGLPAYNVN